MTQTAAVQNLVGLFGVDELEALADGVRNTIADDQAYLDVLVKAIEAQQADLPLTHEQRQVMFPTFQSVFGSTEKPARKVFTRLVLGKPADEAVSWADNWNGTITRGEASKVIDALKALEVALNE